MSEAARQAMIDSQLRPQGVTDRALVAAFRAVPREDFLPDALRPLAYRDRGIALGDGKVMIAPVALALLIDALGVELGDRVLSIGPGSDYAAAILKELGAETVTVDNKTPEKGNKDKAPYDHILVNGAIEDVPPALVDQLADGGRFAAGVIEGGVTRLASGAKTGGSVVLDDFADMQLPVLTAFARKPAFVF